MFMVILLAVLAIIAIASTIAALYKDGYRRVPTDWSRLPDRSDSYPTIGQTMWKVDAGWGSRSAGGAPGELRVQAASTR